MTCRNLGFNRADFDDLNICDLYLRACLAMEKKGDAGE